MDWQMKIPLRLKNNTCLAIWLVALTVAFGLGPLGRWAFAGQNKTALTQAGETAAGSSGQAERAAESAVVSVTKIRTGIHPDFTRIVLDLGAQQEWSLDQTPGHPIRIIIPGAALGAGVRRLDFAAGLVRSIQPVRRSGGVEVVVVCEPANVKVRTLTLEDPDRLVVDVSVGGAVKDGPMVARAAPGPSGGGGVPAGNPADRGPASPPQRAEPVPPQVYRPMRPAPSTSPPAKEAPSAAQAPSEPDAGEDATPLTIVLDPGHGGHDTGAIGPTGLMEKDIVLDLAFRLRRLLQSRLGVRVLMTRTDDVFVSLPDRTALANRVKADFLVSIHMNGASTRGAVGFETFYFSREPSDNDARASAQRENLVIENNAATGKDLAPLLKTTLADMAVTRDMKESSNLAERILSSLEKILRVENRGVKSGPFYVLATAAMPAVLVESAFITNPREERRLQRDDYRQRIAQALYEGIAAYKVRYEQRLGSRNAPSGFGS
jgi:N-acetylmuramoyl-L-alanine amidase